MWDSTEFILEHAQSSKVNPLITVKAEKYETEGHLTCRVILLLFKFGVDFSRFLTCLSTGNPLNNNNNDNDDNNNNKNNNNSNNDNSINNNSNNDINNDNNKDKTL